VAAANPVAKELVQSMNRAHKYPSLAISLTRELRQVIRVASLGILTAALFFGPALAETPKPRVLILTDIGNEVDDQESMVRFLLYSNEYDVEGLVATTSTWMRTQVHPELIEERVRAYGQVLPALRAHTSGYPSMEALLGKIRSGRPEYGIAGFGAGKDTDASKLIIDAVDSADPRPLWIASWGGVVDLAQALWTVAHTRKHDEIERFVSRLRVYTISDQDDAGPWARAEFPKLWWQTSIHAFNDYSLATWLGISAPIPGSDSEVISHEWIEKHIRLGPLGVLYPQYTFLMEGDTPSFLNLISNGLSAPEHPNWGGWGGRYGKLSDDFGLWASAAESARGTDGSMASGAAVSIWRWRSAFQNDFAARIQWSVTPAYRRANHNPALIVNGRPGKSAIEMTGCVGKAVRLSAEGSSDPDGDKVNYRWWFYGDAARIMPVAEAGVTVSQIDALNADVIIGPPSAPSLHESAPESRTFHFILEATDSGTPPLTSYRRVILIVPSPRTPAARAAHCD
jgi:hypothetical protein